MSPHISIRRRRAAALISALVSSATAHAQVSYFKADNISNLNQNASWVGLDGLPLATTPTNTTTSPDTWTWDNRVSSTSAAVGMGNDLGVRNLVILDPGGPVVINGGGNRTLTVANGGGINLSSATRNLTIENLNSGSNTGLRLPGSNTVLNLSVPSGRTLTLNCQVAVQNGSSGATVNFSGGGTAVVNGQFQPTHAVINAGTVEFNRSNGSTRLGTSTTTVGGAGSPAILVVRNTSGSATGAGTVNVNGMGKLTGSGIITGTVNAAADATLSPGDGTTGNLTVGALNLNSDSRIDWEAIDPGNADMITVTSAGGLTVNGGTFRLYNAGTTEPFSGIGTFTLFAFNGAINGTGVTSLAIDESTKIPGHHYTIGIGSGVVTLLISDQVVTPIDWKVNANGNWSTGTNWTGNAAPGGIGKIARIPGESGVSLTAPRTVTLDSARTLGTLSLNAFNPVTLAGTATLTMDNGEVASIIHASGADHVISTPFQLNTDTVTHVEDPFGTLTMAGIISGFDRGLIKTGAGTLALTRENFYDGATIINGGTLALGNGGTSGSVAGSIINNGALVINRSNLLELFSPLSGTGSLDLAGDGTTALYVANTYTGATTVTAGKLVLAEPLALQNSTVSRSSGDGLIEIDPFVTSLTLGGLEGEGSFPLTNTALDPVALNVGKNNASTNYWGSPDGTGASFTKSGTGTLSLGGSHTYTGDTLVSAGVLSIDPDGVFSTAAANLGTAGTATLRVNGGTLNASGQSLVTNASVGLHVDGGVANFTGGIVTDGNNSSAESFIRVNGGTLNAASISLSRGSLNVGPEPTTGQTNQGLYVNGGNVQVSGALGVGSISGANSSVSTRIDAGTLTVGGPLTLGINNPTRWSMLDANGGVLTSTDAANGILLGSGFAGKVIMFVRGSAEVHAPRIQFGQAALAGTSVLKITGGSLYIGAGGMNIGSSDGSFIGELRLEGGVLGASADSTSNVPVKLAGSTAVVTGSSVTGTPHVVTLSGATTGTGALTKSGPGTVRFTSPSNNFSGPTLIEAGSLGLAGQTAGLVTVNPGATLAPAGSLSAAAAVIDGTLAIAYDSNAATKVANLQSAGAISLGAASVLNLNGNGNLTGSAHVVLKAAGGVTGTFATVSGLPDGFSVNYAFDDDSNGATPPVVAIVNGAVTSAYDTWIQAYLTGGKLGPADLGADQDPDGDGVTNIGEFAFDGNPADPADNVKVFGITADGGDADTQKQLLLTAAVRVGAVFTAGVPATGSADGVNYSIEGSIGMTPFTTGISVEAAAILPPNPPALHSGWEWRTFSLDGSNGLTGRGFMRARALAAP